MIDRFNREIYFDHVRDSVFHGSMSQEQVDGQEAILSAWEVRQPSKDLRHLAYPLATTMHETAATFQPIEEYGKGSGQSYGEIDPETGQAYYGRGFVQLTWRDNYQRATDELGLTGDNDLVWNPDRALNPYIAAAIMNRGMQQAWFRPPNALPVFFNADVDDPYEAREIINGDQHIVPDWSDGANIGSLIAGYHKAFLAALTESLAKGGADVGAQDKKFKVEITAPDDVDIELIVNGGRIV